MNAQRRWTAALGILACAGCAGGSIDDATSGDDLTEQSTNYRVGADRAGVFSSAEAATLKNTYHVSWSGAYIGGVCNGGSGWTKSAITALSKQTGWSFMPIYVGQQAVKTCWSPNLTAARGTEDGKDAVAIMKSYGWLPNRGRPVALDVEAGTYFYSPSGSAAYAQAWAKAVSNGGYAPYVYGAVAMFDDFHSKGGLGIAGAWPADWVHSSGFDYSLSPYSAPMSGWTSHNRAWQYGSGYASGIGIDFDVSDLALAPGLPDDATQTCSGQAPTTGPKPTGCGALKPGQGLAVGDSVTSCDGRFALTMQADSNVVLTSNGIPIWASGTRDQGGVFLTLKDDGNLTLLAKDGCPVWWTATWGHNGAVLSVQDDGNAVLRDGSTAIWSTNTGGIPPSPTACGKIDIGHGLAAGESVASCDARFRLTLQADGNFVLYGFGRAMWASNTDGTPSRYASFQSDGNLVVYELGHKPTWAAGTSGHPGATCHLQDDGNLVIYDGGTAIWATHTGGH